MSVQVGSNISGTFTDGAGTCAQSHLVYAANAKVWWLFTLTSASDTAGNPGTHVVKCYVSSGPDLTTATWTAKTDSPNMDGDSGTITGKLWHGRSLGVLYVNHGGGTLSNKDIVHVSTSIYPDKAPDAGNGISFHIRAVLTATTITWGTFGSYSAAAFNWGGGADLDTLLISGNAMGITQDGYICVGAAVYHAELDCSVWTSLDPDTGDVWQSGGTCSGNTASGGSTVTAMTNQTNLKVGMGISAAAAGITSNQNAKVNSIDSSVQVTNNNTWGGASTGGTIRWNNMTCGANRQSSAVIDSTMGHKCGAYAFAQLAGGQMVVVYDDGQQAQPFLGGLKSCKSRQTQANGFWPSTTDGTNCVTIVSGLVQSMNNWCLVGVDTTHVYLIHTPSRGVWAVYQYQDTGNGSWSLIANQPGQSNDYFGTSGVVGVTDGVDFWLFASNNTTFFMMYTKYTVASGQWTPWTDFDPIPTTNPQQLGCFPYVAKGIMPGVDQIGIVWTDFTGSGAAAETFVSGFSFPAPLVKPLTKREAIQQRVGPC